MKCDWKQDENFSSVGYIKNNNYYGEIVRDGQKNNILIKENCLWSWKKGKKEGIKMCFKGNIWDEQEFIPKENLHCLPATISDDLFTPPKKVSFIDLDNYIQTEE